MPFMDMHPGGDLAGMADMTDMTGIADMTREA